MPQSFKISSRHQPRGFHIIYEDRDIIVGNKAPGVLAVSAPHEKSHTAHHALNQYVRKGNSRSHNRVFVVHRLDQDTSGVMVFANAHNVEYPLLMAGLTIAAIPIIIVYLFMQKHILAVGEPSRIDLFKEGRLSR